MNTRFQLRILWQFSLITEVQTISEMPEFYSLPKQQSVTKILLYLGTIKVHRFLEHMI
jgi:hypothetical protein